MMRAIFAAFLTAIVSVASAQSPTLPGFPPGLFANRGAIDAATTYAGPGDVVSGAFAWWGLRCYNAAYTGIVVDILSQPIGTGSRISCATGGVLVVDASPTDCTWVAGNACSPIAATCSVSCFVNTLYDQSGANNCTGAPCNLAPTGNTIYLPSCNAGLPCINIAAGSGAHLTATTTTAQSQPITSSSVWMGTGASGLANLFNIETGASTGLLVQTNFTGASMRIFAGTASSNVTLANTTMYSNQNVFSGASSSVDLNGATTSGLNVGAGTVVSGYLMNWGIAAGGVGADFFEIGWWAKAFSGTEQTNMTSNQRAYWGF